MFSVLLKRMKTAGKTERNLVFTSIIHFSQNSGFFLGCLSFWGNFDFVWNSDFLGIMTFFSWNYDFFSEF